MVMFSKKPKSYKIFGHFYKKINHEKLLKIAQSGHSISDGATDVFFSYLFLLYIVAWVTRRCPG